MSGINNVAFRGTSNIGFAPKPQGPPPGAMTFRANDYPYYNAEPKKSHTGLWLAGTLVAAAGIIAGMGYAHKTNALSKLSDGKIKDILTKCEPAMEKCHEWCAWTKKTCKDGWEAVKGWFPKK